MSCRQQRGEKNRLQTRSYASPGKLNKVFVRKRGVPGLSLDVRTGDEQARSFPGMGPGRVCVAALWRRTSRASDALTQAARPTFPFQKTALGVGPEKGNDCTTTRKTVAIGLFSPIFQAAHKHLTKLRAGKFHWLSGFASPLLCLSHHGTGPPAASTSSCPSEQ